MALSVAPRPCSTCPYRRDTPPGIWDRVEYEKLPGYDADPCLLPAFLCHVSAPPRGEAPTDAAVCRGWLSVHADGIPVRMLLLAGEIKLADVPREPEPGLYASGAEACAAGLTGVDKPSRKARREVAKLLHRRARKGRR